MRSLFSQHHITLWAAAQKDPRNWGTNDSFLRNRASESILIINKCMKSSCVWKVGRSKDLTCFKDGIKNTDLFTCIPGVAARWPSMGGLLCRSLFRPVARTEKIYRPILTWLTLQSKANTLCHVCGISHVLTCLWSLMSSPGSPGWYPHCPIGTPSSRKRLLPWPTMLTEKAEGSQEWVTSYPLWTWT